MTNPITVKYKWTLDEYLLSVRLHNRFNSPRSRFLGIFLNIVCVVFLIMFAWSLFLGTAAIAATLPMVVVAVFILFFQGMLRRFMLRRTYRNNPNKDVEVIWTFLEESFGSMTETSSGTSSWKHVHLFLDTSAGFLIYSQAGVFNWIPFRGFENPGDVNVVREIAKPKVIKYKTVS